MDLRNELEITKTVARMAASVCQTIQMELVDPAQKSGREPVTIADYASQAIIGNGLAQNFPDDGVLSEERSEEFMLLLSDEQRALVSRFVTDALGGYVFEEQVCAWLDFGKQKQARRTWIIDPIDGTKGFLGQRHYCVAISLLLENQPVLGVLASPGFFSDADDPPVDHGALTYATLGSGTYMEPLYGNGMPQPVQVSTETDPQKATFLTSFASGHTDISFFEGVEHNLKRTPDSPQRRLDSQDKYAMVASGLGDAYLRIVPEPAYREKVWDHAAGYVIVTEAGGRVTDVDGNPLNFATGTRMENNQGIVASNRFLHNTILEAIAKNRV
ncbi:MAG: inositol monophosphatase family protein [Anaerolineae bacterium]|nr:inositol monophosphatase family protein [Anaerolineae bacterium]